jgi:hypothetical protein
MASTDQYEFLQNVKLNDVKKVWKKAISNGPTASAATAATSQKTEKTETGEKKSDIESIGGSSNPDKVLKFYTVGDGAVQTLAKNYTLEAAAIVAKTQDEHQAAVIAAEAKDELNYVHCFLDVPANLTGNKPYQALINFQMNQTNTTASKKGKRGGTQGKEIVKIQLAADLPDGVKMPLLLYNNDRSARTFIHPEEVEDSGYDKIHALILNQGSTGALLRGGMKAYFNSKITRRGGEDQDIISVDISELAPFQNW